MHPSASRSRAHTARLTLLLLLGLSLARCGPSLDVKPFSAEELARLNNATQGQQERGYRIEPGDTVQIRFPYHTEMDQEVLVRPDGRANVSGIGAVEVAGLTPPELETVLKERSSVRLRNPEVIVNVMKFADRAVYVGGEVGRPGALVYRKGLTPLQAIMAAGGFLNTARVDSIIIVRPGSGDTPYIARKIDLERVVTQGDREPIHLAPNDIVFVPRTGIANANVWVRQHITELFPFIRGTSLPMPIP
ncbi:MAG TPA: polysaccharide biosynthesis/export family protein [Candidatus Tectomicrobia bacterium]|nr:polysaccharide biosynthesis/export family protein [Candidatus Tectomicrobia bacterium]